MEFSTHIDLYSDIITQDAGWADLAAQCYKAQELRKYYTREEEKLKAELVTLSGDQSCKGGDFVFSRIERKGSVKYADIPAIKVMTPDELDRYRGGITISWKLEKK